MTNYSHITSAFARCSAGDSCPLSATCLRSLMWREPPSDEQPTPFVRVVNLHASAATAPLTEQCRLYRSAEKLRFGRGMSRLFDDVPKRLVPALTAKAIDIFSSRREFYYCKSGKQLVSPARQQALEELFAAYGLSLPPCDSYEEVYDWS